MTGWIAVVSTAYCLTGTMADGSYTREASVASNAYALGTVLEVTPTPTGQRLWVVRDRIGWGTQLDFWRPSCGLALSWGRRVVRIRPFRPRVRERELAIRQRKEQQWHRERSRWMAAIWSRQMSRDLTSF